MRTAWLAFGLLWSLSASGQSEADRFGLFADCKPMGLIIGDLSADAIDVGLTAESIKASAESRLRSARLYKNRQPDALLLIFIRVAGSAYGIEIEFFKRVTDEYERRGVARTWSTGSIGTIGRSSGYSENYIMSTLSQHLDKFILKYLQVNEASCQK